MSVLTNNCCNNCPLQQISIRTYFCYHKCLFHKCLLHKCLLQKMLINCLQGWSVASDSITDLVYIVNGLRPNTAYRFLVRAQNSHGLSVPSPVTNVIKTKGMSLSIVFSTVHFMLRTGFMDIFLFFYFFKTYFYCLLLIDLII